MWPVFILLLLGLARRSKQAGELTNIKEFGVLCRIYRMAAKGVTVPDSEGIVRASKIEREINDVVLANSANDSHYAEEAPKISDRVKENCKRVPSAEQQEYFRGKLSRVLGQAQAVGAKIREAHVAAQAHKKAAELNLLGAIYGASVQNSQEGESNVKNTVDLVFGASRGGNADKNCGGVGTSAGEHVGISLINDFFCLCIMGTADDNWCHKGVGAAARGTAWSGVNSYTTEWDDIKTHCPLFLENATTENIRSAIGAFRSILGAGVTTAADDTNSVGNYILGKLDAVGNGCTGAQNRVCINYKIKLNPGGKAGPGIPWENKMVDAAWELQQMEGEQIKIENLLNHLEMINQTAWESCYEHLDAVKGTQLTEFRGKTTPANSSEASGKPHHTPISAEQLSSQANNRRPFETLATLFSLTQLLF